MVLVGRSADGFPDDPGADGSGGPALRGGQAFLARQGLPPRVDRGGRLHKRYRGHRDVENGVANEGERFLLPQPGSKKRLEEESRAAPLEMTVETLPARPGAGGCATTTKKCGQPEMAVPLGGSGQVLRAPTARRNYSMRTARMASPRIWTSMPSGGRKSEPCTIPPRAHTLPGKLLIFRGSKTVRLQGLPTIGCLA